MEQVDSVGEGSTFHLGLQQRSRSTHRSTSRDLARTGVKRRAMDLVSIHQLERIVRVADPGSHRSEGREISHGVVKYSNSGGEFVVSPSGVRLHLCGTHNRERRIISARDSGIGRLINMSRDVPTVRMDDVRCELMDGSWPALLTVLVWNQMRVIDVVLSNVVRAEDGSEVFDVHPWSDRDRAVLRLVDDCGNRLGTRRVP